MNDERLGYVIGFRELHEQLTKLDQKIDDRLGAQAVKLAELEIRMTHAEANASRRWQMVGVWITSAAGLIAAVIGLLPHH